MDTGVLFTLSFILLITKCSGICKEGEYFNSIRQYCVTCTVCPEGEYARQRCEGFSNSFPCMKCPNGTFSMGSSYNRTNCSECKSCSSGMTVLTKCNSTSDTTCKEMVAKPKEAKEKTVTYIVIGVTLAIFVLTFTIVAWKCYFSKKRGRNCRREDQEQEAGYETTL